MPMNPEPHEATQLEVINGDVVGICGARLSQLDPAPTHVLRSDVVNRHIVCRCLVENSEGQVRNTDCARGGAIHINAVRTGNIRPLAGTWGGGVIPVIRQRNTTRISKKMRVPSVPSSVISTRDKWLRLHDAIVDIT